MKRLLLSLAVSLALLLPGCAGGSAEEEEANWAELRCDAQAGA